MLSNRQKRNFKVLGTESMMRAVNAVREGFENVQCTTSNPERNWQNFSQHSVCSEDIASQRIKVERNGCTALNAANGATRSVQANVKPGLSSAALAVSKTTVIYMIFL
jgi:hypothetical protein